MVLADMAQDLARLDIRLLATDIDPQMIARGRAAVYEETTLSTIPKPLQRFVTLEKDGVHIVPALRNLVSFRELNLHDTTWPMRGRFDIVFCRNVVIYFDEPTQAKLWQRFKALLAPTGRLYVGHSERVGDAAFESDGQTVYRLAGGQR